MVGGWKTDTHTNCTPPHRTCPVVDMRGLCLFVVYWPVKYSGVSFSILCFKRRKITPKKRNFHFTDAWTRSSTGNTGVKEGRRRSQCPNISHFLFFFFWLPFCASCVVFIFKFILGYFSTRITARLLHVRPSWKKSLFKNSLEGCIYNDDMSSTEFLGFFFIYY